MSLTKLEKTLAAALKAAQPADMHCTVAGSAALHGQYAKDCRQVAYVLKVRAPRRFDVDEFLRACGVTP